jgi:CubicO group peptidase (beta-lactamase class C family)
MRTIAIVLLIVALFVGQPSGRALQGSNLQSAINAIDAMAGAEFEKDRVGSVTIGVVAGPKLVWTRSYGLADMERKLPATRDSVYRIGSITKQFTALMLLQLVEDGKVRLSDPVEKYFPEVRMVKDRLPHAPPITLAQLATMTSGLAREPEDLPKYLVGPVAQWEKVLIAALPHTKYDLEPDTQYQYSNIGYAILGAALGRAAATPYTTWVQQRILNPLQMKATMFEPNAAIANTLTKGYEIDRSGNVSFDAPLREHAGRGYKVPNGALYTTIDDLARFVSFELGEGPSSVLPKDVWEANLTRVNSSNGDLSSAYGIGFMLNRRGTDVYLGHSGSVAGYAAQAMVHRASKTGVIVLRNAGGGKFAMGPLTFRALAELAKVRQTN